MRFLDVFLGVALVLGMVACDQVTNITMTTPIPVGGITTGGQVDSVPAPSSYKMGVNNSTMSIRMDGVWENFAYLCVAQDETFDKPNILMQQPLIEVTSAYLTANAVPQGLFGDCPEGEKQIVQVAIFYAIRYGTTDVNFVFTTTRAGKSTVHLVPFKITVTEKG